MELRQLKYFVKVADTLNFSEAAKALCVTQSTLSQQVKQLEGELGTQLLIRSSHSVTLTEAGEELLPYAQKTLHDAELCMVRINDLNQLSAGTLNIGVTYSFSPILTETLLLFMRMYPQIKLNILYKPMAELMELLRKREVDFVLAFKPTQPVSGIESHILFQNRLSAIVGTFHPLASRESVTISELEKYDLALPSQGLQARNAFEHIATPYNHFRIRIELNEVNILLKLIRQSQLVSVLAEATIHDESGVKAIPLDIPDNEMAGCVHTLKDTYRKRSMQEFIRLLGESLAVRERQNAWI
ncbi:MAG: LysR substrate-binding domain-containing protein [Prevotellaceae bacterium]|nr:LysR substrate-binding domain-containing protein [Prevotellaceae bacterium]